LATSAAAGPHGAEAPHRRKGAAGDGGDDCAGFEEPVGAWVDEWNGCVDADGRFHRGLHGGYRDPY
jgi:hypothetical protein